MKRLLSLALALLFILALVPATSLAEAADRSIVYAISDDPEQMDPTLNSYSRSSMVLQQLFRGLYKLDADAKTFIPALAESYTVSDDGMVYTFTLKEGLKWSDGSDLTAHDFEYSWKRVLNPEVASKACSDMWVIKNGKAYSKGEATADDVGVKATDDKTLVVELESYAPWFLSLTSITSYFPVKKDVVENETPWTKSPDTYVCCGPFMPVEFSALEHIKMVKNPYYYNADAVEVENLTYVIIPDSTTELTAYNNGDINVSDSLSADAVDQYVGSAEYFETGRIGIQYCDFNCTKPEFSDNRVRKAFAMAINRQQIMDAIRSTEKPLFGFIPYSQPSLTDPSKSYREVAGDMFAEDVEAAKALLAEAGYPNGEGFPEVEIVCQANTTQKLFAQILGEMWKANLGVPYRITTYESATYWDELANGNFSVDRNGYTCDYRDPVANLAIFVTGSNASENAWDDATFDAMIDAANQITDPAEREKAIIAAEAYLVDQMPGMPIFSYEDSFLVKPNIQGIIKNYIGHINFEYAHFVD